MIEWPPWSAPDPEHELGKEVRRDHPDPRLHVLQGQVLPDAAPADPGGRFNRKIELNLYQKLTFQFSFSVLCGTKKLNWNLKFQ